MFYKTVSKFDYNKINTLKKNALSPYVKKSISPYTNIIPSDVVYGLTCVQTNSRDVVVPITVEILWPHTMTRQTLCVGRNHYAVRDVAENRLAFLRVNFWRERQLRVVLKIYCSTSSTVNDCRITFRRDYWTRKLLFEVMKSIFRNGLP